MYLVTFLCITQSASRCCMCYTIRQHSDGAPPPSRLPTRSPAREQDSSPLLAKCCSSCPDPGSALPTHGQHGKPLTTHAAYMCFSCLHVYSLIAVHKTSTWSRDPESPGVDYVSVTYIKEVQLTATSRAQSPFHYSQLLSELQHECSHCCHNVKQKHLPTWRLPKAQGGGKKCSFTT